MKAIKEQIQQKMKELLIEGKVTKARTVKFTDIARGQKVFVTVEGWTFNPNNVKIQEYAKSIGSCIEFKGAF